MAHITKELHARLQNELRDLRCELRETFEEAFNLDLQQYIDVLKGPAAENFFGDGYVNRPRNEDDLRDDDPLAIYIHGGDIGRIQERIDSVAPFLDQLRPKSAYNGGIFYALAQASMELAMAESGLESADIRYLVSCVRQAGKELGIASGFLQSREFRKAGARSGALGLASQRKEDRAKAMQIWREQVHPGLSSERAAEILRTKFNVTVGHGNLARYVSAEKKKLAASSPRTEAAVTPDTQVTE
ncbi:hypothetical protein SAMN05216345_101530 [Cupriavidus sp. YR651]|uniref:hypothetical protein n=1 Tax=Cupriavidus sp. YR651 TaxID=1855315 RepID=UPI00087DF5E5|nr:hypothetical protein [Cupriavidus sp. YR651]SDC10024.1 hypothetical protein SAMN05216345_101530 [Cupriavidus sp. YR651]